MGIKSCLSRVKRCVWIFNKKVLLEKKSLTWGHMKLKKMKFLFYAEISLWEIKI